MTYSPNVPVAAQSPSQFPAQGVGNFTRIQTLFGKDHQFNLTAAANDGYHNIVHWKPQAAAQAAIAGTIQEYSRTTSNIYKYLKHPNSVVGTFTVPELIIPGVLGMASVQGRATNGVCTLIGQSFNISVSKTTAGYTVAFTNQPPDANYLIIPSTDLVLLQALSVSATAFAQGFVIGTKTVSGFPITTTNVTGVVFSFYVIYLPPG